MTVTRAYPVPLTPADPDSFDDKDSLIYGPDSLDLFPMVEDACERSPSGQHEYAGPGHCECRWCRQPSGLDR